MISAVTSVVMGDIVTLYAGTGTATGFNSWSSGDVDMFLTNAGENALSSVIPEPSVLALVGVFGAGIIGGCRIFLI